MVNGDLLRVKSRGVNVRKMKAALRAASRNSTPSLLIVTAIVTPAEFPVPPSLFSLFDFFGSLPGSASVRFFLKTKHLVEKWSPVEDMPAPAYPLLPTLDLCVDFDPASKPPGGFLGTN
jgi:hypothetical protein